MSVLDFLFEGKPPASVTTYGSSSTNVPTWLSDYTQGLIARANQVSAEPYQSYTGPRIAGFTDAQRQAQGMAASGVGSYKPLTDQSAGALSQVANGPGALEQARPFLDQAGGSYTDNVQKYMNPYVENVINRSTDLAQRALSEKLMPAINKNFIQSGTYGSAAQQRETGKTLRDLTEGIQSNAQAAYAQAYDSGANIYNQDMARQLQAGQSIGNLASSDSANRLEAGRNLGALAEVLQGLQGRDIATLDAVGSAQQQQNQKNLDLAYQDFQNQTNYPRNTIDWMSSIIRGIPYSSSTTSTETGPAKGVEYGPSVAGQLGSLFSIWKGISESDGKARGGLTRLAYAKGGRVKMLPAPRSRSGALDVYRRMKHGR